MGRWVGVYVCDERVSRGWVLGFIDREVLV